MADVSSTLRAWSSTASSNQPSGTTTIGGGLDDNLRQIQAVVRQFLADQSTTVVPSAGVADLTTATGRWVPVSGNSTVTGFGTESAGVWYLVTLTGSPPILNNANISTPGAATISGSTGDMFVADSQGSGVWRIHSYTRASGGPVRTRTRTVLTTSGSTATYSTPAACVAINVRIIGGGGSGGPGGGAGAANGGSGGNTTFGTALLTANGGSLGTQAAGGAGGSASGGDINITGGSGNYPFTNGSTGTNSGGMGAGTFLGGAGGGGVGASAGIAGATNSGAGGGGGGNGASSTSSGGGGGAGGYCEKLISSPSASYTYFIGAGGTASTGGASGSAGGAGGSGIIIVDEFYD